MDYLAPYLSARSPGPPLAPAIDLNPFGYIKGAVEAAVEDAKDLEVKAKITAEVVDKMGAYVY